MQNQGIHICMQSIFVQYIWMYVQQSYVVGASSFNQILNTSELITSCSNYYIYSSIYINMN